MDCVFIFFINNLTESVDVMRTLCGLHADSVRTPCGLPTDTQSPHGVRKDRWGTVKYRAFSQISCPECSKEQLGKTIWGCHTTVCQVLV
jgi:hypothetical protein